MAMDADTKAYLDVNFLHLTEKIQDIKTSLCEKIATSDKGIENLRSEITEIYELDRTRTVECDAHRAKIAERIGTLDVRIGSVEAWRLEIMKKIEEKEGSRKWRIEVILPTAISLLVLAVTIWLAFKFGG